MVYHRREFTEVFMSKFALVILGIMVAVSNAPDRAVIDRIEGECAVNRLSITVVFGSVLCFLSVSMGAFRRGYSLRLKQL